MIDLSLYGWEPSPPREPAPEPLPELLPDLDGPGLVPARVVAQHRSGYDLVAACGPLQGELAGRLRFRVHTPEALPTVGDWVDVAARPAEGRATIQSVRPRRSALVRKAAGPDASPQVLAANVDLVVVMAGLDLEPNARRLERFVTAAWESGATPVVVLSKVDLCQEPEVDLEVAAQAAPGVEVLALSALRREGLEPLRLLLGRGRTAVLLGPSGVGKSTLVNALLDDEALATGPTRACDGRGRHTTTGRQLLLLPRDGGCLIDTPGIRELGLWDDEGGSVGSTFPDVEELAAECRFRDCRHEDEPGCAVQAALDVGALEADRFASYRKLCRELAYVHRKASHEARRTEQRRWKRITQGMRQRRWLEEWL